MLCNTRKSRTTAATKQVANIQQKVNVNGEKRGSNFLLPQLDCKKGSEVLVAGILPYSDNREQKYVSNPTSAKTSHLLLLWLNRKKKLFLSSHNAKPRAPQPKRQRHSNLLCCSTGEKRTKCLRKLEISLCESGFACHIKSRLQCISFFQP